MRKPTGSGSRLSTLEMDKLRKVRALMDGGKTEGERQAARTKATAIAARAGLTLQAALSRLDAQARTQAGNPFTAKNPFQDFGDWMEAKEPGWKAREAQRRAEKEATRLARCKELLAEYGSEDAVFAPTEIEAAIRDALAHLEDDGNSLWSYRGFSYSNGPTADMWDAMRGAVRVPDTVQEAWEAFQAHEARTHARWTFDPDYTSWQWAEAWRSALEHLLNNLRTPTAEGIAARLAWLEHRANQDMAPDPEQERVLVASLQADFAVFVQSGQGASQPAPQRPAQRRTAVLDLLATKPELADREIARRVGCSPQTVGNWRRRLHQGGRSAA
ncbi:MAG: hypothetical protein DI498_13870 [Paracoccus denitrificans]|nr:MAG: hypothetical protein DI498_13870 [Paracoccus denitrificans]PZO82893.1 MAG: hypothetical protein DI633_13870 [Paracoccus denitrificans]